MVLNLDKSKENSFTASVTIFLSLIILMVSSLILIIFESARTNAEKYYMQLSFDSAMESLFSQFHRGLWENYRIFALEYRDEELLKEELIDFLEPYFENADFFCGNSDNENINFTQYMNITDDTALEEEILDYMHFEILNSLISFAGEEQDFSDLSKTFLECDDRIDESLKTREIQKSYSIDSKYVKKIEDSLNNLYDSLTNLNKPYNKALRALSRRSARGFYRNSAKIRRKIPSIKNRINAYYRNSDLLEAEINRVKKNFEADKKDLSPESIEIISSELSVYDDYISEDSEIKKDLKRIENELDSLNSKCISTENEIEDFEDYISDLKSSMDEDDDYDISGEIREFYNSMYDEWSNITLPSYNKKLNHINTENKASLDSISKMAESDLLTFLLPDRAIIPSNDSIYIEYPGYSSNSSSTCIENIIIDEYILEYFSWYHPDRGYKGPKSGSLSMEAEYILCGKDSDYENLSAFVKKLLPIRECLNLIYLYNDSSKRAQVKAFTASFICIDPSYTLSRILNFFVMSIWALAQSFHDIKMLLDDNRVPFMHNENSWKIELSELISIGNKGKIENSSTYDKGLSYKDYLRFYLFNMSISHEDIVNDRMLYLMNENIKHHKTNPESGFNINDCLYSLSSELTIDSSHPIYKLQFIRNLIEGEISDNYSYTIDTSYKYRNETH